MYHGKVLGKIKKFLGKSKFLGKIKKRLLGKSKSSWENQKSSWKNKKFLRKIKKVLGEIKKVLGKIEKHFMFNKLLPPKIVPVMR